MFNCRQWLKAALFVCLLGFVVPSRAYSSSGYVQPSSVYQWCIIMSSGIMEIRVCHSIVGCVLGWYDCVVDLWWPQCSGQELLYWGACLTVTYQPWIWQWSKLKVISWHVACYPIVRTGFMALCGQCHNCVTWCYMYDNLAWLRVNMTLCGQLHIYIFAWAGAMLLYGQSYNLAWLGVIHIVLCS